MKKTEPIFRFRLFHALALKIILLGTLAQGGVKQDVFLHDRDDAVSPQDFTGFFLIAGDHLDPVDIAVDGATAAEITGIELCAASACA